MIENRRFTMAGLCARSEIFGVAAALTIFWLSLVLRAETSEQTALNSARNVLRKEGFKLDLKEFNFSTTIDMRARMGALTNRALIGMPGPSLSLAVNLLEPIGSNSAVAVWKEKKLLLDRRNGNWEDTGDMWRRMQEELEAIKGSLDAACGAALAGPIRFHLEAKKGTRMLLPHLSTLRSLMQTVGKNAVLELHNDHRNEAWTNILASVRLVSAWQPEPVDVSYRVWYTLTGIAFDNLWQALQAPVWSDEQLALLQQEWEQVDFLSHAAEIPAFARACMSTLCQQARIDPVQSGITPKEVIRAPRAALRQAGDYWSRLEYREHGSYEDEKAILLYYRDRELEYKRALQCKTWMEMRQLPGVTNALPFRSKHSSAVQAIISTKQMIAGVQGGTVLIRAAEAETRRRIVVAAIALERFRLKHGTYPKAIQELVPEFLKRTPVDFIDGEPLRYRGGPDGRFVLYSVGLDGVDNGGVLKRAPDVTPYNLPDPPRVSKPEESDLVWPQPASVVEVKAQRAENQRARQELQEMRELRLEAAVEEKENERLARVTQILASSLSPRRSEPKYRGKPLRELLQLQQVPGKKAKTIDELLTPRQIYTGEEPQFATFEVPVSYEAATNIGTLQLAVDPIRESIELWGEADENQNLKRASNGACQIVLNTIFYRPATHAIQAVLGLEESGTNWLVKGPAILLTVSNLCQLSSQDFHFDESGARFYGKFAETIGVYEIEVNSPAGERIKTFSGTSTNGLIRERWDLRDERGARYTNDSFSTIFHITLPGSGRTQTVR